MKKSFVTFALLFGVFVFASRINCTVRSNATSEKTLFQIPQIDGIRIDGAKEDWGDSGFCVDFITAPDGRFLPSDDFDVRFRLGWNEEGLLVLAVVQDDIPLEHKTLSRLWQRDCLELFFSRSVGSTHRHQIVIASGQDPEYKRVRHRIYDWRLPEQKTGALSIQVSGRVRGDGYVVEALLPWNNVGVAPSSGEEIGFQFVANDFDGTGDTNGPLRVAWFPAVGPGSPLDMYGLKLSDRPSERIFFRVHREIARDHYSVFVLGTDELLGESVALKSAAQTIVQSEMEEKNGRAIRVFNLDARSHPDLWPQIEVILAEQTVHTYDAVPSLKGILEKYIEAVGGRDAISRLKTRVCRGRFVDDLSWQEPRVKRYDLEAYAEIPDKWVTLILTTKGSEQNGFDGTVGWKFNTDRIERNDRARRSWLGFLLNPQGILRIEDYFPDMRLAGKETLDGRELYLVDTSSSDGSQNRLSFDAETGLLVRIGQHWEIQDYREADGVKFPFRIATSRKGGESYFSFEHVEHNVSIDAGRFSMPEHQVVFADAFEGLKNTRVLPLLEGKGLTYTHEDMNVPVKDGRFLHDFIVAHGYKRGLEIGTFTGYSTLWMGLAFQKTDGEIITIEIEPSYAEVARENFLKAGLNDVIESRISDALEEIPHITGTFDFVFIDAWKPDYLKYLRLLKDRMRPGGAIIAHNVTNHARDMQDYLKAIKSDPVLETTFNEISAEGMSISIVKK
ncbi:MAG: class I SAM-dependent methyltransferase [Candidatus Aminicenantes bacterium]|jgi:predicted O-methyltransferase YrrM